MLRISSLKMKISYTEQELKNALIKTLRISPGEIIGYDIVKRSIDARDKDDIHYVLSVDVRVSDEKKVLSGKRVKNVSRAEKIIYKEPEPIARSGGISHDENLMRPVIVGFGPAGMICAYKLAFAGLRPIVLERGSDVDTRIKKVRDFWEGNALDPESNVQFGEGGAGTFSDGKLSTMIHDRYGRIREFYRILVENGADPDILVNAKPHVGTDRLSEIVKNIRNRIISEGGEVRFNCRLKNIEPDSPHSGRYIVCYEHTGCLTKEPAEETIITDCIVLAIGHSSRDTFRMLKNSGFVLEPKPFAVGVRMQHPQELIGRSQYGSMYYRLPPADYKLTYVSDATGRSVYSFCMCPGGFVVNASSENGRLAVNGMSNSKRDEATANSAIVVNVGQDDFGDDAWDAGIRFQERLEEKAFLENNGAIPTQLYADFKAFSGKKDPSFIPDVLPNTKGRWEWGELRSVLPDFICDSLIEGIEAFSHKIRDFNTPCSLLMGVESRTSSPVRILREDKSCEAAGFEGIYPCGEGAGYAGGITSAAVDGMRVYEAIIGKI